MAADKQQLPESAKGQGRHSMPEVPNLGAGRVPRCRPQKLSERPQVRRNTRGVTHREWT